MHDAIQFLQSPGMLNVAHLFAFICLIGAVGAAVYALSRFSKTTERASVDVPPPWGLIVGTLRDTFIVTLLYIAEALLYQFKGMVAFDQMSGAGWPVLASTLTDFAIVALLLLVAMVCVFRIRALHAWLRDSVAI